MSENFDHSDLTLHGRFTEDGTQYRLYVLVNGEPIPVQYLDVHQYREAFDRAKNPPADDEPKKK